MIDVQKNELFELAESFVSQTNCNLFLTGKAGTGKTTFLRQIVEAKYKDVVIAAPTGVAAINAGGVTIHSLFQLPFGLFLPDYSANSESERNFSIFDRNALFKNAKLNQNKRKLLNKMELLVIDEISMVKADTMDAIDELLRNIRKNPDEPFGGVQLLCIGDLLQLPPVLTENEWSYMRNFYQSPLFFDANVFQKNPIIGIEFDKIYRQENASFIELLNKIRSNNMSADELIDLNEKYYQPKFEAPSNEKYITLCSHNASADRINQLELQKLQNKSHQFEASVEGIFNETAYPTHKQLVLKEGAQVMFIRNDSSPEKKFFNGKIGIITSITKDQITVKCNPNEPLLEVEKETWENIKYAVENNKIKEEVVGKFKQFPLKLAWAVTIHKSQGLTFEKAIIDAGNSFSDGQVYVALSRLTGPEGLVLKTPIQAHSIRSNQQVLQFLNKLPSVAELETIAVSHQKKYIGSILKKSYHWAELLEEIVLYKLSLFSMKIPNPQDSYKLAEKWLRKFETLTNTALKFAKSLDQIIPKSENDQFSYLHERVAAASDYFCSELKTHLIESIESHVESQKFVQITKKYATATNTLLINLKQLCATLQNTKKITEGLANKIDNSSIIQQFVEEENNAQKQFQATQTIQQKTIKNNTRNETLNLYKEGLSIEEIAKKRGLVVSTIEGHMATFVLTGEINPEEIICKNKLSVIMELIAKNNNIQTKELKELLGVEYNYGEIRIGVNYWKYKNPSLSKEGAQIKDL